MRLTLCWIDDEHGTGIAGEPAFGLAGVEAPGLRMRAIDYRGRPDLDALLADPRLADIAQRVAEGRWRIAVYGKPARPGMPIYEGDRIELLGPITADPKAVRHARVRADRARRGPGKWARGQGT
ncbi:MAG: RnfH family protein [Burkholderiaceae bacterium]|jgi:putative ubiquitin-RnfH superfamily antitoxin RatB of RatAB toxin-antitoxin module|nr:RnfH family protein [Burkholderiaceae bacterium]MEB2320274.1 RnfH family protein [Pseudomonadota bacterium]